MQYIHSGNEYKSTDCKTENKIYIFENENVKISYDFWEYHGYMAFVVFNKTDKPLYINWKNSSYIVNGAKNDYWSDVQNTNSTGTSSGYTISPNFNSNKSYNVFTGLSYSSTQSVTIKPEKITFIPPRSNSKKISFYLMPQSHYKIPNPQSSEESLSDSKNRTTKVKFETFTKNNTPFVWRNFLAFSTLEEGTEFFYIDNEFYLSSVREMTLRHFRGKVSNKIDGKPIYSNREKGNDSFYMWKK